MTNTVMIVYQQVLPEFPLDECLCDFIFEFPDLFLKNIQTCTEPDLPVLDRSLREQARGQTLHVFWNEGHSWLAINGSRCSVLR